MDPPLQPGDTQDTVPADINQIFSANCSEIFSPGPGLQEENLVSILRDPVGQNTASRPCAHYDLINRELSLVEGQ